MSELIEKVEDQVKKSAKDKAFDLLNKVPWWGWTLGLLGAYLLFRPTKQNEQE